MTTTAKSKHEDDTATTTLAVPPAGKYLFT